MLQVLEVFAFCSTHGTEPGKVGWRGHGCRQRKSCPLGEMRFLPAFATGFLSCKGAHWEQNGHCVCPPYLLDVLLDTHMPQLQNSQGLC